MLKPFPDISYFYPKNYKILSQKRNRTFLVWFGIIEAGFVLSETNLELFFGKKLNLNFLVFWCFGAEGK